MDNKQNSDLELTIVCPVYNEGQIIKKNLLALDRYLQSLHINYEIVIVNDGSTDDTLEQASSVTGEQIRIIDYLKNRGKGYAINQGLKASRGRYRLFMDMDLSTDLSEVNTFYQYMRHASCDICIGNRQYQNIFRQKRSWQKALMGKVFAFLSSLCTGCTLADYTCGFKIFTAEACEAVLPHQSIYDWAFDTDLIAIAHHQGLRIHQKPVAWQHYGNSKIHCGHAIITSLGSLWKIAMARF